MRTRAVAFLAHAGAVVLVWAGLLVAESTALGFLWRDQFSGAWELGLARQVVVPLALVELAPLAIAMVAAYGVALAAARGHAAARVALGVVGAAAGAWEGLGLSEGRHFAQTIVRATFVLAWIGVGAGLGAWLAPRVASLVRRPSQLGAIGVAAAVTAWFADSYVLPRLYPAFHEALFAILLMATALVAFASRAELSSLSGPGNVGGLGDWVSVPAVALLLSCGAAVRQAPEVLERASNLRIVLVEHAPLLGRAVLVATLRSSPDTDAEGTSMPTHGGPSHEQEVARSLDWTGNDLLLITVDALRADHVGAYGYRRPTTPHLDELARQGTLFESAYCPTPHTSYSVTSMMTGKYLRPLLALGLGQDSETWAQYLRQYGWRTAAFYPPAVFFIDESRFAHFEEEHLGFEYAKVEFADPVLRERQVTDYLDSAPTDHPLFLWVHFFEPHEPYVVHSDHLFSGGISADVDAYDSEVATADDGIGRILALIQARRPGAIAIVTADHGEEFGEHGGHYHGTTVYEEQVRVPLVIAGRGVRSNARVATVVQTIDLLPTALSALGIPRPARVRGRDLGQLLAAESTPRDEGTAFCETDDYALIASGDDRLVCSRRAAACSMYQPKTDPAEHHDVGPTFPSRLRDLRVILKATERDHGRYEAAAGAWPEALRRGLQGDIEAADDVAALLDDADVVIRRKAAEVSFSLRAPTTVPALRRAMDRDEDDGVRRWSALALVRADGPITPLAEGLLHDGAPEWRRSAALALGERGDARACDELDAWWGEIAPAQSPQTRQMEDAGSNAQVGMDLAHTQSLLDATAKGHCKGAVAALLRSLDDVRARPYIADALGALGDPHTAAVLLTYLQNEPYVTTRPHEARALLALGVHDWTSDEPKPLVHVPLTVRTAGGRLIVLLSDANAALETSVNGQVLPPVAAEGEVRAFDLGGDLGRSQLELRATQGGIRAFWVVLAPVTRGRLD